MTDSVEEIQPAQSSSKGKRRRDSTASMDGGAYGSAPAPDGHTNKDDEIEEEITCGVCRNILDNPYTVLDCLHTIDYGCLSTWWESHGTCPACNSTALSAKKAFQIRAITDIWLESRPHKRRALDEDEAGPSNGDAPIAATNSTPQEIYPYGRVPPAVAAAAGLAGPRILGRDPRRRVDVQNLQRRLVDIRRRMLDDFVPMRDDWADDDDEDFEEDELNDLPLPFIDAPAFGRQPGPAQQLAWPCFCCAPGNPTGYVCPRPIPRPTAAEIEAARVPDRPPQRGEQPLPIEVARARLVPGADDHAACHSCNRYIPRDRQPEIDSCVHCQLWSCEAYDPQGCPHNFIGRILRPRNECTFAPHDDNQGGEDRLWREMDKPTLAHNLAEKRIFIDYVTAHGKAIKDIYNDICQVKLDQATSDVDIWRWGQQARTCRDCRDSVLKRELYNWWVEERAKGQLDAAVLAKPNCWYGFECRTQGHNIRHATTYNHVCSNTQAQLQAPPPAAQPLGMALIGPPPAAHDA